MSVLAHTKFGGNMQENVKNDIERYIKRACRHLKFTPSFMNDGNPAVVKFYVVCFATTKEEFIVFLNEMREMLKKAGYIKQEGEGIFSETYKGKCNLQINLNAVFNSKIPVVEIW